ncbi:NAD(+) diphosphatase [Kineosporiaceae bacterium SCSIO 59966]|nr:NAD(+) diphosphatase [Kineosporiaceae bacterium SCSIO 59966]
MPLEHLALGRAATDRAALLRSDPGLIDRLLADPATRVLRVGHGRTPVRERDGGLALDLVGPGDVPDDALRVFLGRDADGTGYLAVRAEPGPDWVGLRRLGAVLDDAQVGLLTEAVALLGWHETHTHCPRCGAPTEPAEGGWSRRCPDDGTDHYPRTDPAVIMAVVDADDRILLGRSPAWPEHRYSTLAGFVEPGESLEAAVRREVAEEVGVVVGDVEYLGSQPWPFPASLMIGFRAVATDPTVRVDGVEIADARWFDRAGLRDAVQAGQVVLPSGISIARRLVEHWYGSELDDGPQGW